MMKLITDLIQRIATGEINQWETMFPGLPVIWKQVNPKKAFIVVGVIDTGIDHEHPDLCDVIFAHTTVMASEITHDAIGHGTAVAGIIAAKHGNCRGTMGISNVARIMSVRCVGRHQSILGTHVSDGIKMCVDAGCEIVNISMGTTVDLACMQAACRYAYDRNVILVSPTGNEGVQCMYPAAYPEVIAVGAVNQYGDIAEFSSPGHKFSAPGLNLYTTLPVSDYGRVSGTSFAAPVVSGLISLIRALSPKIGYDDVIQALMGLTLDNSDTRFVGVNKHEGVNLVLALKGQSK